MDNNNMLSDLRVSAVKSSVVISATKFRLAKTHYKVLSTQEGVSLLELKPQTGRMHQLRVQCAEAGCPILGDILYADALNARHPLMYLHAYALEFVHPVTRQSISVAVAAPFADAEEPDNVTS